MLPKSLDRDGIEHYRLRAERLMNCLSADAEAWAVAGTPKAGEIVMKPHRYPAPPRTLATPAELEIAPSRAA
jgi:hypothetical protein